MDINQLRTLMTLLCMAAFIGIVFWAYGKSQKKRFEQAARSIFENDDAREMEGK